MVCSACGKKIVKDELFCTACGNKVQSEEKSGKDTLAAGLKKIMMPVLIFLLIAAGVVTFFLFFNQPEEDTSADKGFITGTINVPSDYRNIQQAIEYALDGAEIIVEPGIYHENIDFLGKNITVRSTNPENIGIVEKTILDGGVNGPVVTFSNQEERQAVLDGFTVTNGSGTIKSYEVTVLTGTINYKRVFGGGIYVSGSSPTIRNNIIMANNIKTDDDDYSIGFGGGIAVADHAAPLISNNLITSNSVEGNAGGIGVFYCSPQKGGMQKIEFGKEGPEIINNTVKDNKTVAPSEKPYQGGYGGGIMISYSGVVLENNDISENSSYLSGGGIYFAYSEGTLKNNHIKNNKTRQLGGGMMIWTCGTVMLENNKLENNESEKNGGGIYSGRGSKVLLTDNYFKGNNASGTGGGVFFDAASSAPRNLIKDNTFHNNTPDNTNVR